MNYIDFECDAAFSDCLVGDGSKSRKVRLRRRGSEKVGREGGQGGLPFLAWPV